MQTDQGLRQALIVTRQAPKAGHPREGSFDDPATRQQDKAAFGLLQFDDLQLNAVLGGVLFGLLARVALVHKGNFNRVARDVLDLFTQQANLGTFLFVAGVPCRVSSSPSLSTPLSTFHPLRSFCPSNPPL